VRRFQSGWLRALGDEDSLEALVAAARHVVTWSRRNREEARLLLYGADEFGQADWPAATRRATEEQLREAEAALRSVASALGDGHRTERVILAAVDMPYAVLRRRLRAGDPIGRDAEALVEDCARALLG
jgi:hypothetical protein